MKNFHVKFRYVIFSATIWMALSTLMYTVKYYNDVNAISYRNQSSFDFYSAISPQGFFNPDIYLIVAHIFCNNILFGLSCLILGYISLGLYPLLALIFNTGVIFDIIQQHSSLGYSTEWLATNLMFHGLIEILGLFYFILHGIHNGFSTILILLGKSSELSVPKMKDLYFSALLLFVASIIESVIIINQQ